MIVSEDYPYVQVQLSVREQQLEAQAYVDTGFDGHVIVPAGYGLVLGLGDYVSRWRLGDGSEVEAEGYLGIAKIVGLPVSIPAKVSCLGDEFIIGRGIIDHFRVTFNRGQAIEVEDGRGSWT
jgi:predicted aspartyl protease